MKDFQIPEYETISRNSKSKLTKTAGVFGGSIGNWLWVELDDILYFYFQYDEDTSTEERRVDFINYALLGEQYILECKLQIGMTEEEVYALLPNCIKNSETAPENQETTSITGVLSWNMSTFPEGWCENYKDIIMAQIEYDEELPWYLGLMIDDEGIVRAITTCYPTAG